MNIFFYNSFDALIIYNSNKKILTDLFYKYAPSSVSLTMHWYQNIFRPLWAHIQWFIPSMYITFMYYILSTAHSLFVKVIL